MKMGYILIAIGLLAILAGVYLLNQSKDRTVIVEKVVTPTVEPVVENVTASAAKPKVESASTPTKEPIEEKVDAAKEETTSSGVDGQTESEKKGVDFEKYVVNHFPEKYYRLKEWRSDKQTNGHYAESNGYPDLELILKWHDEEYPFAVECKWRSQFSADGYVQWCNDTQLERYNKFAEDTCLPVFIILGIGGTPSSPSEIYCVPLRAMKYSRTNKTYLSNFQHDLSKTFYYHLKEDKLD